MEMLMKLFQSIGAIVVGGFLGLEIGKLILFIRLRKAQNKEHNEGENE